MARAFIACLLLAGCAVAEYNYPVAWAPLVPQAEVQAWSTRYSYLVWIALLIAVGAVVALIVKNLGKLREA